MDNKTAHDFCLQLLHAETEDEVVEILKKQGYGRIDLYGGPMEIFPIIEALWVINKVRL